MTKTLIEIKRWDNDKVIHSGEFDSVKSCLEDAVRKGISLDYANLNYASLNDASLDGASLNGASLNDASLDGASLNGASLDGASLDGVNLWDTVGNNSEIKSLQIFDEYTICYTSSVLQIGCEQHPISDWWDFDDKRIAEMDGRTALKFWSKNKELIKNIVEMHPAR